MEWCKQIIYTLLALGLANFTACKDAEVAVDYTDDTAYPPPVVNITSPASLEEALFQQSQTVTGSVEASNGLRDIYITLLKNNTDGEYEEIDRNFRVFLTLDNFPEELDFSLNIALSDESTTAIGIIATDIYTKTVSLPISIKKLKGIPPKIELTPSEIEKIDLNESVIIEGVASSGEGLASITYALVRKAPYLELSTPGSIGVNPSETEKNFSFDIAVDDERATAISVTVTDKEGFKTTAFTDIKSITGIPEGRAYIFEEFEMATEWEIMSNSGVIPTQPCLFSIEGIQVGNEIKNVVTLKEALDASSGSFDFAFVNIWRNSGLVAVTSGRGFTFVSAARLNGGPVARQVDTDWLGGMTKNAVGFKIIPQELVAEMNLDNFFETTTGNWETFEALSALDDFVTPAMVTNDANRIMRQRLNASTNGDCSLEITSGTYIAFRRVAGGSEDKLGIMKVIEAADDTDATSDGCKIADIISKSTTPGASAHYTGPNLPGFVYDGVTKLYGRTCKLKIIVQQ